VKFVLDTCVIVSAMKSRTGASFVLVDLASTGRIDTVLTVPLVNEYEDVLRRPEVGLAHLADEDIAALIDSLLVPAKWVTPHYSYRPMLDDPGDEMVLEAAINGGADIDVQRAGLQACRGLWDPSL
jgi:putative PIN family toxin of toxin-antitoxin system